MDEGLRDKTLRFLYQHAQAVAYGALAPLIGSIARNCMAGLDKTPRNSWIVAKKSGKPTAYLPDQIDKRQTASISSYGVIQESTKLRIWLKIIGIQI